MGERQSGDDAYAIVYTYDETGNRQTKWEDGWLTTYNYDANNRLMSALPPLFVPLNSSSSSSGSSSSAGEGSSSSSSAQASSSSGEASTSSGSSSSSSSSQQFALLMRSYWYDDNGNMIREQQGQDETAYLWDTHDRLIGVQYPDGTSQSFVYSDDGLRKRVVERDGRVLDFVWDGANLLGIVDAATGTLQARFTHAGEGYGGLVSQRSPEGSRFYGFDQSSNTRLLSDGSGDVSDRYSYSAYGVARQVLGGSFNPHRFGGQVGYFHDEDGRNYVRARYLDTHNGRWMSSDPIRFNGDDWNLYCYVGDNPTNGIDPSGLARVVVRFKEVLQGSPLYQEVLRQVGVIVLRLPIQFYHAYIIVNNNKGTNPLIVDGWNGEKQRTPEYCKSGRPKLIARGGRFAPNWWEWPIEYPNATYTGPEAVIVNNDKKSEWYYYNRFMASANQVNSLDICYSYFPGPNSNSVVTWMLRAQGLAYPTNPPGDLDAPGWHHSLP